LTPSDLYRIDRLTTTAPTIVGLCRRQTARWQPNTTLMSNTNVLDFWKLLGPIDRTSSPNSRVSRNTQVGIATPNACRLTTRDRILHKTLCRSVHRPLGLLSPLLVLSIELDNGFTCCILGGIASDVFGDTAIPVTASYIYQISDMVLGDPTSGNKLLSRQPAFDHRQHTSLSVDVIPPPAGSTLGVTPKGYFTVHSTNAWISDNPDPSLDLYCRES
jgi:hypothetical protein